MRLPPPLRPEAILSHIRFFLTLIVLLALDQASKLLVIYNILPGTYIIPEPIPVIKNFFYLVHVHNTGGAWSILTGHPYFLALLGLVFLACIFIFRKQLELNRHGMQYTFGFLCGGVIGNLLDRVYYGYVIDFIDIHLPNYRWPAFNIADSAITIGIILYIYFSFFSQKTSSHN